MVIVFLYILNFFLFGNVTLIFEIKPKVKKILRLFLHRNVKMCHIGLINII